MRGRRKGNASLKSLESERMAIGIAPVDTTMFDTFVLYLSRKCDTIFKLAARKTHVACFVGCTRYSEHVDFTCYGRVLRTMISRVNVFEGN